MANLVGTGAGELLAGSFDADFIQGLGGNDDLRGGGGGDRIEGGDGNDQLDGEPGDDTVYGGAGNDTIYGRDSGNDLIFGQAGDDRITISHSGREGDRVSIYAGEGNDEIQVLLTGGGVVDVAGGGGSDLIRVYEGARYVYGEAGQDTFALYSLYFRSTFIIADFAVGDAGDTLDLNPPLPQLSNWDGSANPFFTGHLRLVQAGTSTLFQTDLDGGGDKYETQIILQNTTASSFTDFNFAGLPPDGSAASAKTLIGNASNNSLQGGFEANLIQGLGGNDDLHGGGGGDLLEGGDGNDRLSGEIGDDTVYGGAGNDSIYAGDNGSDLIFGESGDDDITISRNGRDSDRIIVYSGAGNDQIQVQLYGGGVVDVAGGGGNDVIRIYEGARYVYGEAGQDTFSLFSLSFQSAFIIADFATGDAGDTLDLNPTLSQLTNWDGSTNPFATGHLRLTQSGSSTLFQTDLDGGGDNFVTQIMLQNTAAASFTQFNFEGVPPNGSALPSKTLTGTALSNSLQGGFEANLILGLGGNDDLRGGGGGDRLEGGDGNDQLSGEAGDDTIYGGAGNDKITVYDNGNDVIYGEAGDDTVTISRNGQPSDRIIVYGGQGNDLIQVQLYGGGVVDVAGGGGNDVIRIYEGARYFYGEAGQDTFSLFSLSFQSAFIIADFATGDAGDTLDLNPTLSQLTNWDGSTNPFATGHLRLTQSGSSTLFQTDLDGGGDNFVTQIMLQNTAAASFTQFNFAGLNPTPQQSFDAELSNSMTVDEARYQAGADFVVELSGHAGTLTLDDFV